MNYEILALMIFSGTILGLGKIISHKIPVLITLSELPEPERLTLKLKRKIKELNPWKDFSYELFLQKILTKVRILSLKTDNKTFNWLQKLRQGYQKKINARKDTYWKEIKKIKRKPR